MLPKESDFFIPGLARFPLLTGDVTYYFTIFAPAIPFATAVVP